jgi:2-oxoglutarate dehydrogenase E2 component (dihydrolipoamide succinyltransferase)
MSGMLEIRVPAEQSEGTRSQILRWLKAEGDTVSENEPLIEVETDKVTVEIASPGAGVLRQILKPEQTEVEPGDVLGLIEAEGRADASISTVAATASNDEQQPLQGAGRGNASASVHVTRAESEPHAAANSAAEQVTIPLSPAVKRLLSEHGLDAQRVKGTGQGGRVTVDDVLAHIAKAQTGTKSFTGALHEERTQDAATPAHRTAVHGPRGAGQPSTQTRTHAEPQSHAAGVRRVPHSAVRRRVAEHMVRSLMHVAPHVTSVFEADLSHVLAHRARYRAEFERSGAPLTLTAYFLAAIVDAIRAVPEANSRWTDDALEIHEAIHIGIGTALGDQGLVVPVMKHVESLTLPQIATQLHQLVSRAREGKLSPEDVRGGTFTISNHGVSGSLLATPIIINQPQSAILGIGKLEKRVTVLAEHGTDRFQVTPKCYVTLTIDHRVMDGFQANKFLQTFVGRLENWPAD